MLEEIIFKTEYVENKRRYVLNEHYGYGYVIYKLYQNNKEVPLSSIQATQNLIPVSFDKNLIMAVPLIFNDSAKWEGRGDSIYEGKLDSFDSFDEAWSQWMDAVRSGRSKTYIPECFIPRDPRSGKPLRPNSFDNRFIKHDTDSREGVKNEISLQQPAIPHDSYMATYITALDLCLQGIISPSTLGIDVKKLDNAEAQREKEKATLYSRNNIVEVLQETLPQVISAAINTHFVDKKQTVREIKVDVPFGEYANPSFESQVETVGKGRTQGIMSIEACVEELYGDSKDDDWKQEEVSRLKAEQGIMEAEEPTLGGDTNASQSNEPSVPDGTEGIPGTSETGK